MISKWIGRYKLSGEIGFGGMGTVVQAIDEETGKLVAIKLLSPEYLDDLGLRAAFEREARLVTSLEHEAIVPVYDFGQESGQPYLVMEYMPNGSLADRMVQGPLSPDDVATILDRLAPAIDYAHERGVIHRDLKPSNILFDDHGQAYLADFGIAWQPTTTRAASPFNGTPAYLSPEQALGDGKVDNRSDIYALGVILFEMLTGRLPFEGQIPIAIILKQIHDQAPSLRSVDWSLPTALDEVVQKALAKDPAERFSSAGELARAYRSARSGQAQTFLPEDEDDHEGIDPHPDERSVVQEGDQQDASGSSDQPGFAKKPDALSSNQIEFSKPWRAFTMGQWNLAHLITLSLATFIGILMAAGMTAFLRLPPRQTLESRSATGVELSFDRSSLILTNHTQTTLDLSALSFRRSGEGASAPVEFPVSSYGDALTGGRLSLQPDNCFELLLPDASGFALKPGKPLPAIPGCDNLQGWLVLSEPQSWFWVSDGESHAFEVILDGSNVQTCQISEGSCLFTMSTP